MVIGFLGSVFSPYYAWAGRGDPLDHCAINVALYGPRGSRWAMTERGRGALRRDADHLVVGPSCFAWDAHGLTIDLDEIATPWPRRIRGRIRLEPDCANSQSFDISRDGRHVWRPIAPRARVSVDLAHPDLRWNGHGYFDTNRGDEPIEAGFESWTWSRARLREGAAVLYDAVPRKGSTLEMALRFDAAGRAERVVSPALAALPRSRWGVAGGTRSSTGSAKLTRRLEDTPFYSRSLVTSSFDGEKVDFMHESLSLDRVANPLVRLMLPFRMPRRRTSH